MKPASKHRHDDGEGAEIDLTRRISNLSRAFGIPYFDPTITPSDLSRKASHPSTARREWNAATRFTRPPQDFYTGTRYRDLDREPYDYTTALRERVPDLNMETYQQLVAHPDRSSAKPNVNDTAYLDMVFGVGVVSMCIWEAWNFGACIVNLETCNASSLWIHGISASIIPASVVFSFLIAKFVGYNVPPYRYRHRGSIMLLVEDATWCIQEIESLIQVTLASGQRILDEMQRRYTTWIQGRARSLRSLIGREFPILGAEQYTWSGQLGLFGNCQVAVERCLGRRCSWWPLEQPLRNHDSGRTRIIWRCVSAIHSNLRIDADADNRSVAIRYNSHTQGNKPENWLTPFGSTMSGLQLEGIQYCRFTRKDLRQEASRPSPAASSYHGNV